MKISTFIHILEDNRIWHSLKKEEIILDEILVEYIKNNKEKEYLDDYPKELEDLNIIVSKQEEEKKIKELVELTTDKQYQGLYLMTTTSCNLDCDYCFYRSSASGSLNHRQNMSYDVAKKSIDKFYQIVKNNKTYDGYWQQITLYGGEPMLNKPLLKQIIPYVKKVFNDKWTDLVINTNLTILDDELIRLFKENNVIIEVSVDGDKSLHNLHRKTITGDGSYDIVIANAKKLVNEGINVIPMITATNDNVNNFSNIVLSILDEIGVKKFYTNVLITNSYKTNKDYCDKLAEEMVKLNLELSHRDDAGAYDFEGLCNSLIGNDKTISRNSCGATRKITVFPNGEVFACQALEKVDINSMGNLESDFEKNSKWELWKKRNKFNNEECLNCEIVGSCGGGCATGSYNYSGSIYGKDYNQCMYNKALFKILQKRNQK